MPGSDILEPRPQLSPPCCCCTAAAAGGGPYSSPLLLRSPCPDCSSTAALPATEPLAGPPLRAPPCQLWRPATALVTGRSPAADCRGGDSQEGHTPGALPAPADAPLLIPACCSSSCSRASAAPAAYNPCCCGGCCCLPATPGTELPTACILLPQVPSCPAWAWSPPRPGPTSSNDPAPEGDTKGITPGPCCLPSTGGPAVTNTSTPLLSATPGALLVAAHCSCCW
jgi:hypothetical protein